MFSIFYSASFIQHQLKAHSRTMSEQELLKSLLKPLVIFANSGGNKQENAPPQKRPLSKKRKTSPTASSATPPPLAPKTKKGKQKQNNEITIDNFI